MLGKVNITFSVAPFSVITGDPELDDYTLMIWLYLIPAAFLLLGVADFPIGYYTFMRIVVFIASCMIISINYKTYNKINLWIVLFALIAILFNPIIPIYLHDKDIWAILDIVGASIFIIDGIIRYKEAKQCK